MTDDSMTVPATDGPATDAIEADATDADATEVTAATEVADDAAGTGGLPVDLGPEDASLLALVDRLGSLLDRSDLSEIAVEAGGTRLVLRKPSAFPTVVATAPGSAAAGCEPELSNCGLDEVVDGL